jgi:NADH-quinone oxidoreductase subunit J
MPLWLFIFLAVIALVSAIGIVTQRSPVHCLLALAINLLDIGVIFIGLGAVTVGLLQIIIYVGAIMVLFLFVIWLLNLQAEEGSAGHLGLKFFGTIGAAALAAELSLVFMHAPPLSRVATVPPDYGSISRLGQMLFGEYTIAFEVTSVLLLAAIVGAIGLARRARATDMASERASGSDRATGDPTGSLARQEAELARRAG